MNYPNYFQGYPQPVQYPQPMDQLGQLRQQQFQPQYPQQQAQMIQQPVQQGSGSVIRVNNEQEARSYLVAPNCFVIMIDTNLPRIYLKKADASGKADFEIYEKILEAQQPTQKSANPNDEIITLGKLKVVLSSLGLLPTKLKEPKEETVNE